MKILREYVLSEAQSQSDKEAAEILKLVRKSDRSRNRFIDDEIPVEWLDKKLGSEIEKEYSDWWSIGDQRKLSYAKNWLKNPKNKRPAMAFLTRLIKSLPSEWEEKYITQALRNIR